jgi:hypothetical protein
MVLDRAREQNCGSALGKVALGELSDVRRIVLGVFALERRIGAVVELAEPCDGFGVLLDKRLELALGGLERVVVGGKLGCEVVACALAEELPKLGDRLFTVFNDALVKFG